MLDFKVQWSNNFNKGNALEGYEDAAKTVAMLLVLSTT